ncbi:hypothetical protein HPP92_004218 [Vanilla planifolia]|uniref:Uncharacterized protein n=1 Tax=Vanilla planifolia TaxID=51239 RepID=A0A835VA67_VANPL|nr:hypothetical protein HPP92_004218 [Vanilla planifolia]
MASAVGSWLAGPARATSWFRAWVGHVRRGLKAVICMVEAKATQGASMRRPSRI